MPTITLTDDQVIALVKQLPAEQKRTVLLAIAADAQTGRHRWLATDRRGHDDRPDKVTG